MSFLSLDNLISRRNTGGLSASTDSQGRPSALGFKPGVTVALVDTTTGTTVETVTADANGLASFTTVKLSDHTYTIEGFVRVSAGTGLPPVVVPPDPGNDNTFFAPASMALANFSGVF